MATVCIIGAGELGGAVAHALARGERVSRVVIVDPAPAVAAGKALDMQQAGAVEGFHTTLAGSDDETRVTGCGVCVLADRSGRPDTEWQGDAALALLGRLAGYLGDAPVVCAGATHETLLLPAVRELGIPRHRIIGSSAEAFASAVASLVAMEARCAPADVSLAVLGAPPDRFVVPWTEASVRGYALDRVLSQAQLARLEARVRRLWPPGPFVLGLAAARIVEALVTSSRRTFSVLSVLAGEFGVRGRVGALPTRLSPAGVAEVRVPQLNARERVQLETALEA